MEIHLSAAQQASLNDLAAETGRKTEDLVAAAIDMLLAEDASFRGRVQLGIDQCNRGEFNEEEEMGGRVERMLRS
jgi:predicted transcriptional regulator